MGPSAGLTAPVMKEEEVTLLVRTGEVVPGVAVLTEDRLISLNRVEQSHWSRSLEIYCALIGWDQDALL